MIIKNTITKNGFSFEWRLEIVSEMQAAKLCKCVHAMLNKVIIGLSVPNY